ncbi:MAG: hypothetical protein R3C42_02770 [Parvularculaceae bacterium]|nr:hypothetical protein [Parvularculaceae bacterium]
MTDLESAIRPAARADILLGEGIERQAVKTLNAGALANGWLIVGGEGIGKATFAYRLARALLWSERPPGCDSLDLPQSSRAFSLVASGGHPDLFTAARIYDEKKERYATEITVDTIRELTHFLSHTASMGGWRVAIIDTADDLNRSSANALLKALEEPPPRTAIFVLSAAPGRLLATIRSRCRRIELRPLADNAIADFLAREGAATGEDAIRIARAAGGRPGFALSLALGDGAEAVNTVEAFWTSACAGGDISTVAQRLAGKTGDGIWPHFHAMLVSRMADEARREALTGGEFAGRFADLREEVDLLFTRGEAVNVDRAQLVLAAGRAFSRVYAAV